MAMNAWNGHSDSIMSTIAAMTAPPSLDSSKGGKQGNQKKINNRIQVKETYCEGCGDIGDVFLQCKTCSVSYHPVCDDPPLDEDGVKDLGDWYCKSCRNKKNMPHGGFGDSMDVDDANGASMSDGQKIRSNASGLNFTKIMDPTMGLEGRDVDQEVLSKAFKSVIDDSKIINPTSYEMPTNYKFNDYVFPGTSRTVAKKSSKPTFIDLASTCVPRPIVLCFTCKISCRKGPLIKCDYCPSYFHFDCLTPPLTTPPVGLWMCPLHPEPYLESTRLQSTALSERVKIWDLTSKPFNSHAVVTTFLKKCQRTNPLFAIKKQYPGTQLNFDQSCGKSVTYATPSDNRIVPETFNWASNGDFKARKDKLFNCYDEKPKEMAGTSKSSLATNLLITNSSLETQNITKEVRDKLTTQADSTEDPPNPCSDCRRSPYYLEENEKGEVMNNTPAAKVGKLTKEQAKKFYGPTYTVEDSSSDSSEDEIKYVWKYSLDGTQVPTDLGKNKDIDRKRILEGRKVDTKPITSKKSSTKKQPPTLKEALMHGSDLEDPRELKDMEYSNVPSTSESYMFGGGVLRSDDKEINSPHGFELLLQAAEQCDAELDRRMKFLKGLPMEHVYKYAAQKLEEIDSKTKIYTKPEDNSQSSSLTNVINIPKPIGIPVPVRTLRLICANIPKVFNFTSHMIVIGTDNSAEPGSQLLNPLLYVNCKRISRYHACIFFYSNGARWEILNYSPYGMIVNNYLHTLKLPSLPESNSKPDLEALKTRILKKRGIKVKTCMDPSVILRGGRPPLDYDCPCKEDEKNILGEITHEGGTIIGVGSKIQIGCLKLVVKSMETDEEIVYGAGDG